MYKHPNMCMPDACVVAHASGTGVSWRNPGRSCMPTPNQLKTVLLDQIISAINLRGQPLALSFLPLPTKALLLSLPASPAVPLRLHKLVLISRVLPLRHFCSHSGFSSPSGSVCPSCTTLPLRLSHCFLAPATFCWVGGRENKM